MNKYLTLGREAGLLDRDSARSCKGDAPLYLINDDKGRAFPAYGEDIPVDPSTPTDRDIEAVRRVLSGETKINRVSHEQLEKILGKTGKYGAHAGAWYNGEFYSNENLMPGEYLGVAAHEAVEGETQGTSIDSYRGLDSRHINVEFKTIKSLEIISRENSGTGKKARIALDGYKAFLMEGAMAGDPLSMGVLRN